MRSAVSSAMLLLVTLMVVSTAAAGGKNKKDKGLKGATAGSECSNWRYGNCVPSNGDCGAGTRDGSCDDRSKKMKCKVPCNWKKEFGADCKYKFESWGECDSVTNAKSRTGTLKKALYQAECHATISVSKPCTTKTRTPAKGSQGTAARDPCT
ncbi:midkine a [Aplochiton taeniatus]